MSPTTTPSKSAKETDEVVKLVTEQGVATVRSTLGRRRSKREALVPGPSEPHSKKPDLKLKRRLVEDRCELPSQISDDRIDACIQSFASVSDSCSRVLRRLARAVSYPVDHLADT